MPYRPKVPCRHPGCPELVESGKLYCAKHLPLHPEVTRSAGKRGYGSSWVQVIASAGCFLPESSQTNLDGISAVTSTSTSTQYIWTPLLKFYDNQLAKSFTNHFFHTITILYEYKYYRCTPVAFTAPQRASRTPQSMQAHRTLCGHQKPLRALLSRSRARRYITAQKTLL